MVRRWGTTIGQKHGFWTVKSDPFKSKIGWTVTCECRCGEVQDLQTYELYRDGRTRCLACHYKKPKHTDLRDRKYNRWTVLHLISREAGRCMWRCECECGNRATLATGSLTTGHSKGCLDCRYKSQERNAHSRMWNTLISGAKVRGLEVTVSWETVLAILADQNNECALTGQTIRIAPTSKEHLQRGTTASVDRIDSTKGYIPGNIQWVHKDVNRLKMDQTQARFIEICRLVVAKHGA